jgi:hypothetical protein
MCCLYYRYLLGISGKYGHTVDAVENDYAMKAYNYCDKGPRKTKRHKKYEFNCNASDKIVTRIFNNSSSSKSLYYVTIAAALHKLHVILQCL